MSHSINNDEIRRRLDRYLDGLMTSDESIEFEKLIATNSQLTEEVALQAEVDATLRSAFKVTGNASQILNLMVPNAVPMRDVTPKPARRSLRPRQGWLIGALTVIIIVSISLVGIQWFGARRSQPVAFVPRSMEQIYRDEVSHGFEEYWVCDEESRFAATFFLRHGQALQLANLPAGVRMKGLSYLAGLSRDTTAMLAVADGKEVLVFIDRKFQDRPVAVSPEQGNELHRFRKELGNLVLYEITPWSEPKVLPFLRQVEPPKEFLQRLPGGHAFDTR